MLDQVTTDQDFRDKIARTLKTLEDLGEAAKIYEAMRTEAQQREKVRQGNSRTMKSYHLKRGSDGKGLAVDIADAKKGWGASRRFWLILGANCEARGLSWGGIFGFNRAQKQALLEAINELRAAGWPKDHPLYHSRLPAISWDPAHVSLGENTWS